MLLTAVRQILDVLLAGHELVPLNLEIIDRICRCYYRLADLQPRETKELYLTVGQQFSEKGREVARQTNSNSPTVKQWEEAFQRAFAQLGEQGTVRAAYHYFAVVFFFGNFGKLIGGNISLKI